MPQLKRLQSSIVDGRCIAKKANSPNLIIFINSTFCDGAILRRRDKQIKTPCAYHAYVTSMTSGGNKQYVQRLARRAISASAKLLILFERFNRATLC